MARHQRNRSISISALIVATARRLQATVLATAHHLRATGLAMGRHLVRTTAATGVAAEEVAIIARAVFELGTVASRAGLCRTVSANRTGAISSVPRAAGYSLGAPDEIILRGRRR